MTHTSISNLSPTGSSSNNYHFPSNGSNGGNGYGGNGSVLTASAHNPSAVLPGTVNVSGLLTSSAPVQRRVRPSTPTAAYSTITALNDMVKYACLTK